MMISDFTIGIKEIVFGFETNTLFPLIYDGCQVGGKFR